MSTDVKRAGWRLKLSGAALAVSIFAVIWFAAAALGTKYGLWGWQFGLGKMFIAWGPFIAVPAVLLGLVAFVLGFLKFPRTQPVILGLAALLIASMLLFRLLAFGAQGQKVPPIHDIQTDWNAPIQFSEALIAQRESWAARHCDPTPDQPCANPVSNDPIITHPRLANTPLFGRRVAEVQKEAERDRTVDGETIPAAYDAPIEPLYFDQSPDEIAQLALNLAEARGWEIFTPPDMGSDVEQTMLEATATSGWFGFKDDVAIRITAVEGATRVDMRSISRVGLSDLGANAKRVSGFLSELGDRADGRTTR